MNIFNLSGKKALVTGAGRGIGKAVSSALAEAGAEVFAVARTVSELENLTEEIRQKGGKASFQQAEVTDLDAMRQIVADHGPFQILVNNAGSNRPTPVLDSNETDYDFIFNLNTKAPYFLSAEVARDLIARNLSGSIIHVSSQMGHIGAPNRSVYCGTKHAVEGFTKVMAWEWGKHNIRVNSVCPTFIETPLTQPMLANEEFKETVCSSIALGRVGQTHEVAWPVVFLASEASSLITGSALMVDGGWTAR